MNFWQQLFSNRVLVASCVAWAVAQVLKAIIYTITHKKFELSRLMGDGGMPSGHSATVTALTTACAVQYGVGSFEFAVTATLAIIVMHDAMGVRLETGKQAHVLNELMEAFQSLDTDLPDLEKLKEFVGHTPIQVGAGLLLGLIVGLLMA